MTPAGEELVAAIHSETEGNPLFVSEVVRLLSSQGRLSEPDAHRGIPPGVRSVIGQRVRPSLRRTAARSSCGRRCSAASSGSTRSPG